MLTGWVKPPTPITGLDHLGTQSPCTLIYSQLLPGITNVTDRARYYSIYPWIVRSLDLRYKYEPSEQYVENFRRADCLLTLISERHARILKEERHGQFMIGRLRLVPALEKLEKGIPLKLSTFATQADGSPDRYFQRTLGGLGQYYVGQLAELRILHQMPDSHWVKYTPDGGTPLAQSIDELVGLERFWATVEADSVSLEDLDDLRVYCACGARTHEIERKQLLDIFFARTVFYAERTALGDYDPSFRRDSLHLLLSLAGSLAEAGSLRMTEDAFRGAVYSASLPGEKQWQLPTDLERIRIHWSIYERNDLLSIACLGIFSAALQALQKERSKGQVFRLVENFAAHLSRLPEVSEGLASLCTSTLGPKTTFSEFVQSLSQSHPSLIRWQESNHEIKIAEQLIANPPTRDTFSKYLASCLAVLALLSSRESSFPDGYGDLLLTGADLENYPINLTSFADRVRRWADKPLDAVLEDLISWCLNTHLSVALRKLRQTRQCSFHLQPAEDGLRVLGVIPAPVSTLPRINQALQIMADLGALEISMDNGPREFGITDFGRLLLGELNVADHA